MRKTEPTTITQGDELEWTRLFCNYPATEWNVQYRFRGPGTGFNADATADGSSFAVEVPATDTAAMAVGTYQWQAWATEIADPTIEIMIASGSTDVRQGFSSSDTGEVETRSAAKIMLDSIDAALAAFASSDVLEYEITTPAGSRRVKRSDKTQLMEQRKYWAGIVTNEIAREGARNGKPLMNNIHMRVYDE